MVSRRSTDLRERNGELHRRSAVIAVGSGILALAGGTVGLVVSYLANAFRRSADRKWLRVAPAEQLNAQTFERYVLAELHQHAWRHQRTAHVVYIKDLYPADPIALSATCTHLGCTVAWNEEAEQFRCPCHGGIYNENGQVIEGPPPEPLARLDVKIEGQICFVRLPERRGALV